MLPPRRSHNKYAPSFRPLRSRPNEDRPQKVKVSSSDKRSKSPLEGAALFQLEDSNLTSKQRERNLLPSAICACQSGSRPDNEVRTAS